MKARTNIIEDNIKILKDEIGYEDNDNLLNEMYSRARYKVR